MTTAKINKFDGKFRFLSNFYPSPIFYDGILYPTVEHAFQAAKTLDVRERKAKFNDKLTPGEAKRNGRHVKLRPDWEEVKVNIMYELVLQKFTAHPLLAQDLLKTYPATLIEGNHWHDHFWGVCDGTGENKLGLILMKVRDQLRRVAENPVAGTSVYTQQFIVPSKIHEQCQMTGEQLYDKLGLKRGEQLFAVNIQMNYEYDFCLEILVPDNPNELPQIHPYFLYKEGIPYDMYQAETLELDEPDGIYGDYEYFDERTNTCLTVHVLPPNAMCKQID